MIAPAQPSRPDASIIQRLLSPIAEVRKDEVASVLLLTLIMFLVLGAYYMLKTAREVFILTEGGAEVKSYSSAGQALLLLMLVPAYGAVASRLDRTRLVQWVTLFFASHLAIFLGALASGHRIAVPFFLWLGIFNLMVIAQFWAFANDLYTEEQGKRLFPLIGAGSSLGAWVGSVRAGQVVQTLGTQRLLLAGATVIAVCAILARFVDRVRPGGGGTRAGGARPLERGGGFALVISDRYLMSIAALTLILNVVNTSGEYLFARYVVSASVAAHGSGPESTALREAYVGRVYASYFSAVNLTGFILQLFVVSRLFKFLGIGRSLLVHPLLALGGYLFMLRGGSMPLMSTLKIADNSLDYSLGNTTRQALWLSTSREAKYKAKQAIDAFVVRIGDVVQAGLVFAAEQLAFAVPAFAAINVVMCGAWLAVAFGLKRQLTPGVMPQPQRRQA